MTAPARNKASKARTSGIPAFRPVQLATLVDHVPPGNGWLHEMKFDGYRCLIAIGGGQARAYTRSGLDWSDKFAPIITAAAKLKVSSALLDGEAVVLDENGRSNFQALQASLKSGRANLTYYAFDLLELNGEDLANLPQITRKERLEKLIGKSANTIRYSAHIVGKLSLGYRGDFFLGAMDGGIDVAKKENVGFYGPFATSRIGLGG